MSFLPISDMTVSMPQLRLTSPGNMFSVSCCPIFCANCGARWSVTGPQLVGFYRLPFLFLADRMTPGWSSAAVAHLRKGWTCCAFKDGFLHFLVVKSGCFIYCCLSIISNHSSYFDLSTSIRHFLSTQLPLPGYFLFFGLSVNTKNDCASKSRLFPNFLDQPT